MISKLWPTGRAMIDSIVAVLLEVGDRFIPMNYQASGLAGTVTSQVGTFTPDAGRGPFIAHGMTSFFEANEGNGFFSDASAQLSVDGRSVFYSPVTFESIVNRSMQVVDTTDWAKKYGAPIDDTGWPAPLPLARGATLQIQKNNFTDTQADLVIVSGFHCSQRAYERFTKLPVLGGFGFEVSMPAASTGLGANNMTIPRDLFARFWGTQCRNAFASSANEYARVELNVNTDTVFRMTQANGLTISLGGPALYTQPCARIDMPLFANDRISASGQLETGGTARRDLWTILGMQDAANIGAGAAS